MCGLPHAQAQELARAVSGQASAQGTPGAQRRLMRAIGLLGETRLIPWLIERMNDPALARVSGEAFCLITGADLAAQQLERLEAPPAAAATPGSRPAVVQAPPTPPTVPTPSTTTTPSSWTPTATCRGPMPSASRAGGSCSRWRKRRPRRASSSAARPRSRPGCMRCARATSASARMPRRCWPQATLRRACSR